MSARVLRIVLVAVAMAAHGAPSSIEQETLAKIEQLRAVKTGTGAKPTQEYNKQMDEAWQFFDKNKALVLPILARELDAEIRKSSPNDLVLLDIGSYLSRQEGEAYKPAAKRALFAVNPDAEIVRWNSQGYFELAYRLADDRDPKMLDFLDKAFLSTTRSVFVPQHAMTLDATLQCVFLYGKFGPESEVRLRRFLSDPKLRNRVVEILIWIGSSASLPDVVAASAAGRNYDTFARATAFMMGVGGPEGRAAMLAIDPKNLDPKSKKYLDQVLPDVKASSYDTVSAPIARLPDYKPLTDEEVRARLQAMYKNHGKDDQTHPMAILNSTLPKAFLIDELTRIRSRMLYRLSDEALDDVKMTNALINALKYRSR